MDAHYHLAQKLNTHASGGPDRLEFLEILRMLYTTEEADLALHLGWRPESVERIAQKTGISTAQVATLCENMANKGLVYALSLHERTLYALLPMLPGMYEDPLMIGNLPGVDMERLGKLWTQYYENGWGNELHGSPTNLARVLPHEGSVAEQVTVLPFEEAAKYIDEATYISLGNCSCRLAKKGCDHPIDVCLGFGSAAKFLAERKAARLIDKAEAHAVLRRAEESGLVHCASNIEDEIDFLCACCPCCSVLLGAVSRLKNTASRPHSNFYSTVDANLCTSCAICQDRCPVQAISMNGTAKVDTALCIGCGLCATACAYDAVALLRKSEVVPPHDHAAYNMQIAQEKGRRQLFEANSHAS
jgi:Fe-S-cluster-containing hydrogenase component 2